MSFRDILHQFQNRREKRMPERLRMAWERLKPKGKPKPKAKDDEAELLVYGEIGMSFWGDEGNTSRSVVEALNEVESKRLRVRINSPGGDVFEGLGIYTALSEFDGDVTVQIDGLAASAAAVIAMAGDVVEISEAGMMMIHDAWGLLVGNAQDAREFASVLDKIDSQIAGVFAKQTGKDAADVRKAMDAESWFTAKEAVAYGLADGILGADEEDDATMDRGGTLAASSSEASHNGAAAARAKLRLWELDTQVTEELAEGAFPALDSHALSR